MTSKYDIDDRERQRQAAELQRYAADERSVPVTVGGKPRSRSEKRRLARRQKGAGAA
jgi:hypothetical protein